MDFRCIQLINFFQNMAFRTIWHGSDSYEVTGASLMRLMITSFLILALVVSGITVFQGGSSGVGLFLMGVLCIFLFDTSQNESTCSVVALTREEKHLEKVLVCRY
ncbi:hypothetical protein F4679DRAFT_61587 [Xylaria curta]|nr:hypothetical protein F4679DRAFT_61587 [Xylaria curta]